MDDQALRLQAVKLAIELMDVGPTNVIVVANDIYEFISGPTEESEFKYSIKSDNLVLIEKLVKIVKSGL